MTRSVLLAALVAVSLAACSGAASAPAGTTSGTGGTAATAPPTPPAVVKVDPRTARTAFPTPAVTATLRAAGGSDATAKVFQDMPSQVMVQSMAQGAAHLTATFVSGLRLDGTVTRVAATNGLIEDWWFHGTVTRGTDVSEVLLYADLRNALAGVLWVRDARGFSGRPWGRLDVTAVDLADAAAVGRLQALVKDHPGLAFGVTTMAPLLPWLAGSAWDRAPDAVAAGPFPEQHAGRPTTRFDLTPTGKDTCRLWLDADSLPVEQIGCLGAAVRSVTWDAFGAPGTGFGAPPAADTADVAKLLS